MCIGFWWDNLRERDHWSDADVDTTITLRWMKGRYLHRVLVCKPEGKRPLGRSRHRWEDNIIMH
jgi:hypothetical protein